MAMYMPYLHGKQEELMAVLTLGSSLGELVVPIIKPVNLHPSNTIGRLARIGANARFALITNSDKGPNRRPPTYPEVVAALGDPRIAESADNMLPAFELRGGTALADFETFSRDFADKCCVVIHKGHTYNPSDVSRAMHFAEEPVHVYVEPGSSAASFSSLPSRANILLRDGFRSCERNALYPSQSAFDDLVYQYPARNFAGFGDCCMIGDAYSPSGGPAQAVALHLTENRGQELLMNHFVSSSVGVDTPTMYFEALNRLVTYVGVPARRDLITRGVREYLESNANRHFPGLGSPKRWSAMHHMEIVLRILESQGTAAAF